MKKEAKLATLERHIRRLEQRMAILRDVSNRYAWVRLGIFAGGAVLTITAFILAQSWLGVPVLLLSLAVFIVVAVWHARIDNATMRHRLRVRHLQAQIARIKLDWKAIPPENAEALTRQEHPFETDLDITGEFSLHRLVDTAATREGSLRLRDWLLAIKPDLAIVKQRQNLLKELVPLVLFRDKLMLKSKIASPDLNDLLNGQRLIEWLERNAHTKPFGKTIGLLTLLASLNIGLLLLNIFGILPAIWLATLLAYGVIFNLRAGDTNNLYYDTYTLRDGLVKLKTVLGFLETRNYEQHPQLKKLCAPLLDPAKRPSQLLKRVSRVIVGVSLQRNPIWIILNILVPWRFYFAYLLNQCKAELAAYLPGWLEVWFELEALNSLANFAYLNPEYTVPDVVAHHPEHTHACGSEGSEILPRARNCDPPAESSDGMPLLWAAAPPRVARLTINGVVFETTQIGHPLIPTDKKVCNDFKLADIGEMVIITGSNMAGKSSFLRTLGINLCLAYAGGHVNAESLQTNLFRLFTCIKVSDSVTDGFSYFYAEVRRLKAMLQAIEQPDSLPVFFLIDEIFKGTNNRERLIGSQAYLQALISRNCLGCVSTHDLELVHLADNNPTIRNYHFREEVIDGQMSFDYRLRDGACPTTNALKIMQLEGLPIP